MKHIRVSADGGACEVVYVESLEINPKHDQAKYRSR